MKKQIPVSTEQFKDIVDIIISSRHFNIADRLPGFRFRVKRGSRCEYYDDEHCRALSANGKRKIRRCICTGHVLSGVRVSVICPNWKTTREALVIIGTVLCMDDETYNLIVLDTKAVSAYTEYNH
jgi:hypothetical protein